MAKKINKAAPRSLSVNCEKTKLIPSVCGLNEGQKNALKSIANKDNHIIFISGIAGTGKSYISASWGMEQVLKNKFDKIIITRPYVEAGESLGFLPGTFADKLAPFMAPIFDVLQGYFTASELEGLIKEGKVVTLPIAYMRGVTFKNSFVLLDEAQNCTIKQMHLFLTRIGEGSKVVITGDVEQSDLGPFNGFKDALSRLADMKDSNLGLDIVELDANSVVRHPIIPELNKRYEKK